MTDPLAEVRHAAARFPALAAADHADPARFYEVAEAMHAVSARVAAAERAGCDPAAIRAAAGPAREAHALSPFVRRLQTWPRGYPGDFETIEYLLAQVVRAPHATLGFWIEYYALGTMIAQQHRNKVAAQAREVERALAAAARPRVLVLAAGSSPDLARVLPALRARDCAVVIHDGDAAALAFSLDRLGEIRDRVTAVGGNVLLAANKLAPLGPFDLVLAGGLFDYLPDRAAGTLIRAAWDRLLAPGGRFFFTNLGTMNPNRPWMEYLADWRLIERSEADLLALVGAACGPAAGVTTEPDPTGLAWLVGVDRPG